MNIRELHLFIHLAGTLHFGQTSRACNITRSGLTRSIQRLEHELGEQLFLRDNRTVALTRAGELFREYAVETVQRFHGVRQRMTSEKQLRGELTLYCSVTAILSILPGIIEHFRRSYPDVHLHLSTGDAAMALPRLENGEADIAIAALPEKLPRHIVFLKMLETPLIFISPRNPGEGRQTSSGSDWLNLPVVMPERGLSRIQCEQWFADRQLVPDIYSYVAGNEAMIAMVAMGCGIGVVPRLVLENSPLNNRIKVLDIQPSLRPFTVGICTTRSARRGPLVQAFWRSAEKSSSTYIDEGDNENNPDYER